MKAASDVIEVARFEIYRFSSADRSNNDGGGGGSGSPSSPGADDADDDDAPDHPAAVYRLNGDVASNATVACPVCTCLC